MIEQRVAMDWVTFELGITIGDSLGGKVGRQGWEARGGNGFTSFRVGNHYCDTLGRQREAIDLVTFGVGITTATRLGGNGKQWIR